MNSIYLHNKANTVFIRIRNNKIIKAHYEVSKNRTIASVDENYINEEDANCILNTYLVTTEVAFLGFIKKIRKQINQQYFKMSA